MPDDTHMELSERVAALEQTLVARDEALEYQTATSEVLQVTNLVTDLLGRPDECQPGTPSPLMGEGGGGGVAEEDEW
jgi:hypothetical protein